jgi:hypothetical protein
MRAALTKRYADQLSNVTYAASVVGRCTFTLSQPVLRAAIIYAIDTKHDGALSNFAFNFNLRLYSVGDVETVKTLMRRGLPVDSGDYDFRTTLHLAGASSRPLLSPT